ncbi:MAG: carboxypeptidase-like regulatory domain-containing protein, partial [Bacteroidales bacterium]|nr:carboxypeptidase-like regulatory domain-containing protein [Bacteroidales bacterium]
MVKKIFFFILIIKLFAFTLSAQDSYVRGTIYDSKTGESMPGVAIVVKGTTTGTTTDLDGKYSLKISPGKYDFEISFISYETILISGIEISLGQVLILDDIKMNEEGILLSEVTVAAKEVRNTENSLVAMKRNSVNLLDGISSSGFKKTGDSDAASSMKRITGVSVSGGKYVYVRGLGDRYTKTILNGMEIPGLDPDRNTVQMDMFPTNIIDNIIVSKTFSAELPADFTGGVVNIETKDFPDSRQGSISLGLGYNPGAHFNPDFLTYKGGNLDFLGFDDGTRAIPATTDIPQFAEVVGNPDGAKAQRYKEILSSFNPNMAAIKEKSLMDYEFSSNFGNQVNKNKYTIGYNFAVSYKYSTEYYQDAENGLYGLQGDKTITELDRREYQIGNFGTESVFLNGLAGFAIKTKNSKYRINLMHLQNGESKAGIFDFYKTNLGSNFDGFIHSLDYSQRGLTNIIIDGKHRLKNDLWNLEWKISPSLSSIQDPDIRFTRYEDREGVFSISTESGFPERIWRELNEFNISALINASYEFETFGRKSKLNFGASNSFKQRDFIIRNYAINIRNVDLTGDPDEIFSSENLWPLNGSATSGTTYEVPFIPVNPNKFNSSINNIGVYTSYEFSPFALFRAIVGIRIEKYVQHYTGRDQLGLNILKNDIVLDNLGYFPTVNLIYTLSDIQNLRLSASKTIARPSFKELSYAEIFDPITGRTFIG